MQSPSPLGPGDYSLVADYRALGEGAPESLAGSARPRLHPAVILSRAAYHVRVLSLEYATCFVLHQDELFLFDEHLINQTPPRAIRAGGTSRKRPAPTAALSHEPRDRHLATRVPSPPSVLPPQLWQPVERNDRWCLYLADSGHYRAGLITAWGRTGTGPPRVHVRFQCGKKKWSPIEGPARRIIPLDMPLLDQRFHADDFIGTPITREFLIGPVQGSVTSVQYTPGGQPRFGVTYSDADTDLLSLTELLRFALPEQSHAPSQDRGRQYSMMPTVGHTAATPVRRTFWDARVGSAQYVE